MNASPPAARCPAQPAARTRHSPDFDPVARIYRWAELLLLGPLLTRTREHFLSQLTHCRQALILGDGDGRFTARLLATSPHLQALAVDSSASMLRLLQSRCAVAGCRHRLRSLQTSVEDLPGNEDFGQIDLIVTHFLLDCLPQPAVDDLARLVGSSVAPNCLWVLSEFATPARQPWRLLGSLYIRGLYLAFRILTGLRTQRLPDPQKALASAGFVRLARNRRLGGLLYSELWKRP